jgi:deazaflavin-dependent oxidoreductase (nitroreductase family)
VAEPLLARLHFVTRFTNRAQGFLIQAFRRYFERAPGWVLLTTRGRKSGLAREVLLPCERFGDGLIVISTYARRSNWIRNIEHDHGVKVTAAGWTIEARAEIVDDLETKRALVAAHPFFAPAPVALLNMLHRTLLRPLTVAFLRRWVTKRPVIVIRPTPVSVSSPTAARHEESRG